MTRAAYGTVNPVYRFIDAEPVRQHVLWLKSQGLGNRSIAHAAGLDPQRLKYLLSGDGKRAKAGSILEETAVKIMGVRPGLDNYPDRANVDSTISRRKIEALMAMGWSQRRLASLLGLHPTNLGKTMRQTKISAMRARQIRDLFNRMWDKRPPRETKEDEFKFQRAMRYARSHRLATAMAWDDIEDVNERHPRTVRRERRIDWSEVPFLRSFGMNDEQIAKKIGVAVHTLRDRENRVAKHHDESSQLAS